MPYSFAWVCKDVVKKLQGRDLNPVKCLSDAMKFRQFEILQKNPQSLFWKSEDTPVGYSILQILEPNCPVPAPEVSSPIPLKHNLSWKLKANAGVNAIVEGSASTWFGQSCVYDIEVRCTNIPDSKLESLQNRKLLDREPSFVEDCRMGIKDLHVVTEAFEVTKDAVLEGSSSVELSGKVGIPQVVKEEAGCWEGSQESTRLIPLWSAGSGLAYLLMETRINSPGMVKSILQPNFKYPWNIPFTLQPQLLAPLQGEGLTITYELLKECGLKMELNNSRSTWDLEAKMPLSALYGSLSLLQQLVDA
nr:gasdermin-C-like [Peromyscus maniculatus bairdii]